MNYRNVDPYEKRNRRWWLLVAAVLVALIVGWLIGRADGSGDGNVRPPATEEPSLESGLDDRSEDGAVAAATTFIQIMTAPSADEDEYRQALLALAAPDWMERAAELAENTFDFVEDRYGDGARLSFHPIRYRVLSYTDDEARIDIWGVLLGIGPKLAGIEESWATGTLQLVWVENQWKVQGQSSEGGPTPETLRAEGSAAVPSAVEGFEEYGNAPRP